MDTTQRWNAQRTIHVTGLVLLAIITVAPLIYMLVTSVRTAASINRGPSWIPSPFTLSNYTTIFHDPQSPVFRWFLNSAIAVGCGTFLTLLCASLAAYALARLDFPGRTLIFYFILASMLIPAVILVIPVYSEFARFNLIDTYAPLILVYPAGPFGVFLLRQFYLAIPRELEEAATIDGAGKFRRWYQIVLPLSRAPLITLAILTFVGIYNDFFWPLVATQTKEMRTVTVGIAIATQGGYTSLYGQLMALSTLAAVPTILLFVILQRYFVASSALSGVKG
jgi:multiple sugar transport system permease protein